MRKDKHGYDYQSWAAIEPSPDRRVLPTSVHSADSTGQGQ